MFCVAAFIGLKRFGLWKKIAVMSEFSFSQLKNDMGLPQPVYEVPGSASTTA